MSDSPTRKILATVPATDFVGRASEIERLRRHARGENESAALLFLSAPATGASEILKQFYDQLFDEPSVMIPVYFALKKSDQTAANCARRFVQTFIAQVVAYRRREPKIFDAAPDITELAELAAPEDAPWIDRLVDNCEKEFALGDEAAFVRACLSAPLRAGIYGAPVFVMIDHLHEADFFDDAVDFLAELKEVFRRSSQPFVFGGNRRFLLNAARIGDAQMTDAAILQIEPLPHTDAATLVKTLADGVEISDAVVDLIVRQMNASPLFIRFLLEAANASDLNLDGFQPFGRIYADEIFGGRIKKFYERRIDEIAESDARRRIVELLYRALDEGNAKTPVGEWRERLNSDDKRFEKLIRRLNSDEIVRFDSDSIEPNRENEVLSDYLRARYRLEIAEENRALLIGEMTAAFVQRAPQTMTRFYRERAAIDLRAVLQSFDNREVSARLIDYGVFKTDDETATIRLPQIVYTAHTATVYPALDQAIERNRSAFAVGFAEKKLTADDGIVWLAAQIDSKLEAATETAEFWCDRLEMVALNNNFTNYKIWLIAPEGFAPDALDVLRERDAYGSSIRQFEELRETLGAEIKIDNQANEYEIVLPMGDDAELIAAGTIENIARRHNFSAKSVNQIKTALVEACINATEHSLSPDRRIYQKFTVEADKIVVIVSNRGLRLADVNLEEVQSVEGRRGWGLKLMRTLMDEVKIEQVDDGTRISMVKFLNR